MRYVVTGSLGHIGKPLTETLIHKGHNVVVVSSNPAKTQFIHEIGAEAAIGSVHDPVFLERAFDGADAVYTMVPPAGYFNPNLDPISYFTNIGMNYAKALERTQVPRVVNLSSWGAHRDNGNGGIAGAYHVEQLLNQLPAAVSITHLRPTSFYYNLLSFIPAIKKVGVISAAYGGDDVTVLVSPSDIADAAAEELGIPDRKRDVRYVASEEIRCRDVASILGNSIGIPGLNWTVASPEQVHDQLINVGMPPHMAALMVELQLGHHQGIIGEDYFKNRPAKMGRIKIADFAKKFALAFNK